MAGKKKEENYNRRILESIFSFLEDSGQSAQEIRSMVDQALDERKKQDSRTRKYKKALGGNVDTIYAVVLHRWHRDKALLGEDAKPRPIRLLGKTPSLEALIKSESPETSSRKIALSLKDVGLVKKTKTGRYVPTSRIATVSAIHPMLVEHVSKSLARYLDTVRQNTSPTRSVPTLIERYTHIPDLRESDVIAFRNFAQTHGSAFLASVDDWLEGRRTKRTPATRGSTEGVSAGIHVFAYVDEPKGKRPSRRAKRA